MREHAGRPGGVAENELHQPGLESKPRERGGLLDRASEPLRRERPDEVDPAREERSDPGSGSTRAEEVRADGDDDLPAGRDG